MKWKTSHKRNTRARVQRNSDPVEKAKEDDAHRRGSQSMSADMDCRKDLHRYFSVFQQAEFLCVGCNNHITQLAHRNGLRKGKGKGIFTQKNEKTTQLIPPIKKDKSYLLCIHWIVDEDDMCDNVKWHAFIYNRLIGHRHCLSFDDHEWMNVLYIRRSFFLSLFRRPLNEWTKYFRQMIMVKWMNLKYVMEREMFSWYNLLRQWIYNCDKSSIFFNYFNDIHD